MSEPIRLSKRVMQLAQCSRRDAELYIEGGWVSVGGAVVEQPHLKVTDETIELHPQADTTRAGPVTIIRHSPTVTADAGMVEVTVADRWPEDSAPGPVLACHLKRLQVCLPLAPGCEGLQVLTQDEGLIRYLSRAQGNLEQEFVVQVQGQLDPTQLASLNHGLSFRGRPLPAAKVSWQSEERLRFALKNPQPGQLLDMCQQVGLQVQQIKRIRIGGIPLRKMPLKQWRYLPAGVRF